MAKVMPSSSEEAMLQADLSGTVALRFVDNHGKVTERYPANPNGSPRGITGLCSRDGRVTIMMPHPERVFRAVTNSGALTSGRKTAAGCACSATPGSGSTERTAERYQIARSTHASAGFFHEPVP